MDETTSMERKILRSNGGPLNEADPVQHAATECLCANRFLDECDIQHYKDGRKLSLVGRIQQLMKKTRKNVRVGNET